jgi:hypothetical protein
MNQYDKQGKVDPAVFEARMRPYLEQAMQQVMQVVNQAPDGKWIAASEDEVAQIMAQLRQQVYQTALQMRIDADEAAFSPSERRAGPRAEQGASGGFATHPQRTGEAATSHVSRPRPGQRSTQ